MPPPALLETEHRPWPMPRAAWKFAMSWCDLAFLHWPLPAKMLAAHLPPGVELETFDGEAWIGVVPFRMADVRARFLPPVPTLAEFPELNVRTYVSAGGKPGVWFFSLDAASRLAVRAARAFFHLPYFDARMAVERDGDSVRYRSERTHRRAPEARFSARYRPLGAAPDTSAGTLEHWLTERYCLYAANRRGRPYRSEIHHEPWSLRAGEAEIERNDMTRIVGVTLPDLPPLVHVAERMDVIGWFPSAV